VTKVQDHAEIPHGKAGYYFAESGEASWGDISSALAHEGHKARLFTSSDILSVTPEDFATRLQIPFINAHLAEVIWASK
jgi:hypothetical protein